MSEPKETRKQGAAGETSENPPNREELCRGNDPHETGKKKNLRLIRLLSLLNPFYPTYVYRGKRVPIWRRKFVRNVLFDKRVTSIGKRAFYDCFGLTSVTIPDGVTSIGEYAFYYCSGLTSVYYTGDVAGWCSIVFDWGGNPLLEAHYLYIGNELVTELMIPNSVTSIGNYAFSGCSGLTSITIPDSVTSIGGSAFWGCSGLTSVTIPDSVTSIGESAFLGCFGLTSITIPDSVASIGGSAFWGCSGLTSVTIPDSVTSIGDDAFRGCSKLTSVTIPDSVTSIGRRAFAWCSGLTSITIPDSVTSIGECAFSFCYSLTSITIDEGNPVYHSSGNCVIETESKKLVCGCKDSEIPSDGSVTSIGNDAFLGSSNLPSITIPDSVTSIGESAFRGCSGLTSITIPNSVTSIGVWAFFDCSSLTSITFHGTEKQWNAIAKGSDWDGGSTGNYTVHYTGETIPTVVEKTAGEKSKKTNR